MEEQESVLSFNSTEVGMPEPQDSLLTFPEGPPATPKVPRNIDEVAIQLTAANAEPDYKAGILKYLNGIQDQGQHVLHEQVWEKRRQDEIGAARSLADQYAAEGNADGVQSVLGAIDQKYGALVRPSRAEAQVASAQEAIENTVAQTLPLHDSAESFTKRVDDSAESRANTNILQQSIAEATKKVESDAGILNTLTDFGGMLVTGGVGHYSASVAFMNDITGSSSWNKFKANRTLVNVLAGMDKSEQDLFFKKVTEGSFGPFGLTTNPVATLRFLRELQEYSKGEFIGEAALMAFDPLIIGDAMAAIRGAIRMGKGVKVVKDTAGSETAGKLLSGDLTNGTANTGLNDAEKVSAALASGRIPSELDPAAMSGLSSEAQQALQKSQRTLYEQLQNRIVSSGLTEAEVKTQLAAIRNQYDPATSKAISSVIYGTGDELGQNMTVYWQGPDGRSFLTKEAATAYAKSRGMANFEIIEKSTPDINLNFDPSPLKDAVAEAKFELEGRWVAADAERDYEKIEEINEYLKKVEQIEKLGAKKKLTSTQEQTLMSLQEDVESYLYRSQDEAIGSPLWEGGNQFAYSAKIDSDVQGVVEGLAKLFGFEGKIAVSTVDDFEAFARRDWRLSQRIDDVMVVRGAKGAHFTFDADGALGHAIVLNTKQSREGKLYTIAHEMGHAFDREFLTANPGARTQLQADFSGWMLQKGYSTDAKNFKDWIASATNVAENDELVEGLLTGKIKGMSQLPPKFKEWATRFDEYWAEQFGKFAFTDAKPVSVMDKYFKGVADAMKRAWEFLSKALKLRVDAGASDAGVTKFLKDHIKAVEEGREIARNTDPSAHLNRLPKPHIKLKMPDQDKVAGDPVGYLIKEQRKDPLKYANGSFSEQDIASMPWVAVDPKHGASNLLVEERVVGVHAEAKIRKDFTNYIKPFYDKLGPASRTKVFNILTEGDAYSDVSGKVGKEFTALELKSRGLSDDESAAYFATRGMRMVLWTQRNADMSRHLTALGNREFTVTINDKGVGTRVRLVAKQLDETQTPDLSGSIIYDARTGTTTRVTKEVMDGIKSSGAYIAELYQPTKLGKKNHKYVIGHPDHTTMRDITTSVPYRPGEFSRIYTDEYFITAKRGTEVDGKAAEWMDTIRTARSEREAKEFVGALQGAIRLANSVARGDIRVRNLEATLEKIVGPYMDPRDFQSAHAAGEFDDILGLDFHYTRNKEEYLNGSVNEAISSGRTFVSKRGERIYSVDRRRENTLDVFKSIQAEMANVSRVMSISQWRENAIRRWMVSFGDKVPNRSGNDVADFFKAANMKFAKKDQASMFAERTHKYIMRQIGVKTPEEQLYDGFTRGLTERFMSGNETIESLGVAVRQKGFLGFLRNVNFNLTLGMWNPAQLLVQANGAATALSLSPIHGLAAGKTFPLLRMALMSDNPAVWKGLASMQKLSDMGLSSSDEFEKLVVSIQKTGILDNLKSTALWNQEEGAMNIFGGYGSKVWGTQAFFFNRGEEFSRVISFDVARREWMAAHKGADWSGDFALKDIVKRMDDLTQNMTKANLAGFQTGTLSIPFQFLQYNIKLATNVITAMAQGGVSGNWTRATRTGRGFSKAEALQLMAAHLVLYGAAGNGVSWVVDEMMGEEMKDTLSVEQKTYIGQGLIAGLINSLSEATTGESTTIAVGSRLGTFDYYQRLANAAFSDPANIYEALLGPTAATAKRVGVVADVANLWYHDPDVTGRDVIEGLASITKEQVASLRNATKAYIYYQNEGRMTDKKGVPIGNVNQSEILATAIGFQPAVAVDVYNMYNTKKDHDTTIRNLAEVISSVQKDIMFELSKKTADGDERAGQKKKLLQALWPDNGGDMLEVQRHIKEKIYPYDSQFQKLVGEHVYNGYNYEQPLTVTKEPKEQ